MSDCCSPKGYRWIFSESSARAEARRYRRKGLDSTSRRIVELVKEYGVQGRTVLEVGGGIGAIQIELLRAGADRAISIELTPTYEEVATDLLRESGLEARVERRVMDFTETNGEAPTADIVIMNRVICCYPDMPKLAAAAADRTGEMLLLSYPRETWWMRIGLWAGNLGLRLARREFQVFLHSPRMIRAASERHGLRTVFDRPGGFWTVAALRRT